MRVPPPNDRVVPRWLSVVLATAAIALPAQAMAIGFVISEIMFEAVGGENKNQWVELYNGTNATIDLGQYSLGWGRDDYTHGTVQLPTVDLLPGEFFVLGGPNVNTDNGSPAYDWVYNFDKDLRKGNKGTTDGVALFNMPVGSIDALSVPFYSVIYGDPTATTVLLDETGGVGTPMVTSDPFNGGESIVIGGTGNWAVATDLTPGTFFPTPEPGTGVLLATGLVGLAIARRRRLAFPI